MFVGNNVAVAVAACQVKSIRRDVVLDWDQDRDRDRDGVRDVDRGAQPASQPSSQAGSLFGIHKFVTSLGVTIATHSCVH